VLLLGLTTLAPAIPIVYMDTAGSDTNDGSSPTDLGGGIGPKLTLPSAFTAVDAGGTINVAAGVYNHGTGFLNLDKAVNIVGAQNNVDPRPSASSTRAVGNANESQFNVTLNDNFVRIAADNISMRGLVIHRTAAGVGGDTITSLGIASPNLYDNFYFGYNILGATNNTIGDDALNLVSFGNPIIEYNYINNARTTAIKIRGGSSDAGTNVSDGMIFRFNDVNNVWNQAGSTSAGAIDVIGEARNNQIIGNRITNTGPIYGILVGNTNDTGLNAGGLVLDNYIDVASGGISVSRVNTVVQGNNIRNIDGANNAINAAMTVRSFGAAAESGVVFRDNIITSCPMAATRGGGLLIGAGFTDHANIVIEGNDFTFITPFAIKNSTTTNVTANNCYFGGATPTVGTDGTLDAQTNISTFVVVSPVAPAPVVEMDINWGASDLDFGQIPQSAFFDLTIDLGNSGNTTVPSIPSPGVVITGPDAARFSFTPPGPTFPIILGTPGVQTLSFRYNPAGNAGPHTATATVNYSDSVGPVYSASFTLTGDTIDPPGTTTITAADQDGANNCQPGFSNQFGVLVTATQPVGGGPAEHFQVSEDPGFSGAPMNVYSGSGPITVGIVTNFPQGMKTIYGRFVGPGGDGPADDATITIDIDPPTASAANVTAEGVVSFDFTEVMNPVGSTTAANYAVSGSGAGTLPTNPTTVVDNGGGNYTLTWLTGDMVFGGDVTVTATGVSDPAGNPIGIPNDATAASGGIPVELSAFSLE